MHKIIKLINSFLILMSPWNNRPPMLLKCLPPLFFNPGIPSSELISGTNYVDWGFLLVFQFLRDVTFNQVKPLPSTFFPIHCSLASLSFEVIAELKPSSNEPRINVNLVTKNSDHFPLGCLLISYLLLFSRFKFVPTYT